MLPSHCDHGRNDLTESWVGASLTGDLYDACMDPLPSDPPLDPNNLADSSTFFSAPPCGAHNSSTATRLRGGASNFIPLSVLEPVKPCASCPTLVGRRNELRLSSVH